MRIAHNCVTVSFKHANRFGVEMCTLVQVFCTRTTNLFWHSQSSIFLACDRKSFDVDAKSLSLQPWAVDAYRGAPDMVYRISSVITRYQICFYRTHKHPSCQGDSAPHGTWLAASKRHQWPGLTFQITDPKYKTKTVNNCGYINMQLCSRTTCHCCIALIVKNLPENK